MYRRCIKRLLDIILALIGLILLSPVFLILMLLVRKKLGSPVFFHQERPGKDGKIFGLMKFRSMTDARDEEGISFRMRNDFLISERFFVRPVWMSYRNSSIS